MSSGCADCKKKATETKEDSPITIELSLEQCRFCGSYSIEPLGRDMIRCLVCKHEHCCGCGE